MRKKYYSPEEKPLPRWVVIPLGIIFFPFTLLSIIISLSLIFSPNVPITVLTVILGSLLLIVSLLGAYFSLRMIFVNPNKANFTSPTILRVSAFFAYFFAHSSSTSRSLLGIAKQREKTKINFKKKNSTKYRSSPQKNKLPLKAVLLLIVVTYFLFNALNTDATYFGRRRVYLSTDPVQYFFTVAWLIATFVGCIVWIYSKIKKINY